MLKPKPSKLAPAVYQVYISKSEFFGDGVSFDQTQSCTIAILRCSNCPVAFLSIRAFIYILYVFDTVTIFANPMQYQKLIFHRQQLTKATCLGLPVPKPLTS